MSIALAWIISARLLLMIVGAASDNNVSALKTLGYGVKIVRLYLMSALFAIAALEAFNHLSSARMMIKYEVLSGLILLGWLLLFYISKWGTDKIKSLGKWREPDPDAKGLAGWFARLRYKLNSRTLSAVDEGVDVIFASKADLWLSPLAVGAYIGMIFLPSLALNPVTNWLWNPVKGLMAVELIAAVVDFVGAIYALAGIVFLMMPFIMLMAMSYKPHYEKGKIEPAQTGGICADLRYHLKYRL